MLPGAALLLGSALFFVGGNVYAHSQYALSIKAN